MTEPFVFSADETCDVGKESGSTVWEDYGPKGNEFSGEVNWVLPSHLVQMYNVFGSGGLILFERLVASRSP